MKRVNNEKGLTLVEVLAALVILGIMFVGIMTIFPQMTLFNAKTETKLDTMNLVRQEMEKIVSTTVPTKWEGQRNALNPNLYETFPVKIPLVMGASGYAKDTLNTNPTFVRYKKISGYRYEADIYLQCESLMAEPVSGRSCNDPDLTQLYKVHLKVFKGNQLSSETYSYIKFTVKKQVR
ncbi:type II secretion system protein [Planococcus sp. N028]|uniref:Type II secretion system protein n=1 Tax=Planococcus shixiaomingii TaxID=3058393 RepID=A0ABT8MXH7_9BACL|nr:type II secretion system protein [Planococcus sp. N028]MDN7240344.1 type II secretion system protein [Planococcus sp. N028]